jgi:hypothetical protein
VKSTVRDDSKPSYSNAAYQSKVFNLDKILMLHEGVTEPCSIKSNHWNMSSMVFAIPISTGRKTWRQTLCPNKGLIWRKGRGRYWKKRLVYYC